MNYKQAFYSKLEDCYLGAKIKEQGIKDKAKLSGFSNLLSIKEKYFKKIQEFLESKINSQESDEWIINDIYNKLFSFFESYLNNTGTPFFNDTPIYKNIHARVYTNTKDTSLFYKTQNLYYVKSDTIYTDLTLQDTNEQVNIFFDTSTLIQNSDNAKTKIFFKLDSINITESIPTITIKITRDKHLFNDLNNVFKQNSLEFSDDFLKALKEYKIHIKEEELKKIFNTYKKQSDIDFFIHKNARAFLREQFDLYMFAYLYKDNVLQEKSNSLQEWDLHTISHLQNIKRIALGIIDLIADFENELKAIWLKPKFAKNTQYVFTRNLIKDSNALQSLLNDEGIKEQIQEWQDLKLIDETFSKDTFIDDEKYQFLPFDTKHFSTEARYTLLSSFTNLESMLNGELIKADNFQALNSIKDKYADKIDLIYIDPPYNTGNDGFIYNDKFNHSSWLTMMHNRLELAKEFLNNRGSIFISIDDNEQANLKILCDEVFGEENFVGNIVWLKGNAQNDADTLQRNQEYILCYAKDIESKPIYKIKQKVKVKAFLDEKTNKFYYEGAGLTTGGAGGTLNARSNLGFSIYYNPHTNDFFGKNDYDKELAKTSNNELKVYTNDFKLLESGYEIIRPPKKGAKLGRWTWALEKFNISKDDILIRKNNNSYVVLKREWLDSKQVKKDDKGNYYAIIEKINPPKSFIDFVGSGVGSKENKALFNNKIFNNPKPEALLQRIIEISTQENDIILDFFAGSGTTAHAIMELNRKDNGNRKFILVEMGEHCYNVIIPRIKKVAFSSEWKDGKLKDNKQVNPMSIAFRYYELESYEEALQHCEYVLDSKACIDYKKSRKLIKSLDKGEIISIDMSDDYRKGFDIFTTMSNLLNLKIKRLFLSRDSKGIESHANNTKENKTNLNDSTNNLNDLILHAEFDNDEIIAINNIDLVKYPKLRNLLWWE